MEKPGSHNVQEAEWLVGAARKHNRVVQMGNQRRSWPATIEAIEKLRAGAYDLIISDLRMPQLDGPGLYREVARRHPRLLRRMVFVTGDTLGPESTEFLRQSEAPTFSKPFVATDVRRAVRQAMKDR